jgi:HAD superfamily hydrolase (TIGR01509 family)
MRIEGVVFDFNGTLFWDTPYQNRSWDAYLKLHNITLTSEEKNIYIHGRNGKDTFEYLFKREFTSEEINELIEEKEVLYRNECLKNNMELAPGSISFLNYLNENGVKLAIATASGKTNVDFFIEKFDLYKFFEHGNIIFNDGAVKGKPHPDLFQKAIKSINIPNQKTIIFEDSKSGIEAARRTDVKEVFIVNSTNDNWSNYDYKVISHYDQVDRSLFN